MRCFLSFLDYESIEERKIANQTLQIYLSRNEIKIHSFCILLINYQYLTSLQRRSIVFVRNMDNIIEGVHVPIARNYTKFQLENFLRRSIRIKKIDSILSSWSKRKKATGFHRLAIIFRANSHSIKTSKQLLMNCYWWIFINFHVQRFSKMNIVAVGRRCSRRFLTFTFFRNIGNDHFRIYSINFKVRLVNEFWLKNKIEVRNKIQANNVNRFSRGTKFSIWRNAFEGKKRTRRMSDSR